MKIDQFSMQQRRLPHPGPERHSAPRKLSFAAAALGVLVSSGCAGDVVNVGDGALEDPSAAAESCDDGAQNGDETGIDCGGSTCEACFLQPCECDSSDTAQALACEARDGELGWPLISDDGNTVAAGVCNNDVRQPCRLYYWNAATGGKLVDLHLPAGKNIHVRGVSQDGETVLIQTSERGEEIDPAPELALVYRASDDSVTSTDLLAVGSLLSANGTVVGLVLREASESVAEVDLARWSEEGGLELLGDLGNQFLATIGIPAIYDLTPDASIIVGGLIDRGSGLRVPFRYSDADGLVVGSSHWSIPDTSAAIMAISRDGSTLAGVTFHDDQYSKGIFRWTALGGLTLSRARPDTGAGTGSGYYKVLTLSDDGSVVAGTLLDAPANNFPFRWTEAAGIERLRTYEDCCGTTPQMSGDGTLILNDQYAWTADREQPWRFNDVTAPWRMTYGGAYNGVDLSHGKVFVGSGTCGGMEAIYRRMLDPSQ